MKLQLKDFEQHQLDNDDDLEVYIANPQSGSSLYNSWPKLEFGKVGFEERGKLK